MASKFEHTDLTDLCTKTITKLEDNRLPTKSDVLKLFFNYTKNQQMSTDDSIKLVLDNVLIHWRKVPIETIELRNCITRFKNIYNEFRSLQKYQNMNTKKINFLTNISSVFDISHARVFSSITANEKEVILSKPFDEICRHLNNLGCQNKGLKKFKIK